MTDFDVAVVGAGVVGSATALELARRGASVALLEAEPEPGLQASATNSGILHTGFDSKPGELETELILRAAELRDPVIESLGLEVMRCGALMRATNDSERQALPTLAENARANGVEVTLHGDDTLEIPGEAVSDPAAFTLALAEAATRHGCQLITGAPVGRIGRSEAGGLVLKAEGFEQLAATVVVNCAGLGAGALARAAGDESFDVYPRKGEFLVFDGAEAPLERILLPVPSPGTKGILVFPTLDGKVVAGPTAVDQEDSGDWSVRREAREEIVPKAARLHPPLAGAEPIAAYAGLRPAGRGVNYVIGPSRACPGLVHAAAIRSTGLTASLGIAERVAGIVEQLGVELGERAPLERASRASTGAWWRRTAERRGLMEVAPR
ncbi:MAG TPA: FAD-dependent oxidoreductase [Solirubrobacterales bacterium]|nr:FAD-dependent oxidoreductase [Solirubrobacterales bacterium]